MSVDRNDHGEPVALPGGGSVKRVGALSSCGRLAVQLEKARVVAQRPQVVVEVDPDALGFDAAAARAGDRVPARSRRPSDAAAPRLELDRVLGAERVEHAQLRAAHDPHVRVVVEARVEPVLRRDVLEVARDRVEPQPTGRVGVREADAPPRREDATHDNRRSATARATAACPSASRCSTSSSTIGYAATPSRSSSGQSSSSANDGPRA